MLKCLKGKRLKMKYTKRLFFGAKVLTAGMMVVSSVPLVPGVYATEGALRTYTSDKGDVFIGGEYIELGISKYGTFGSEASPDKAWGFHNESDMIAGANKYKTIGMIANENGWSSGLKSSTCDYFLPGTVDEGWSFAYKDESGKENIAYAASTDVGRIDGKNIVSSSTQLIDLDGKKAVQTVVYLFEDTSLKTLSTPTVMSEEKEEVEETVIEDDKSEVPSTLETITDESNSHENADDSTKESETFIETSEEETKSSETVIDPDSEVHTVEASIPVVKDDKLPSAKIKLTIVYSFDVNQKGFHTKVTAEKLVDEVMNDMCYARSFDPDQNAGLGNYATYQFIENTAKGARITAYGGVNQAAFIFDTKDSRAKAGCYPSLGAIAKGTIFKMNEDKYLANTSNLSTTSRYEDNDIYLIFNLADTEKSTTTSFEYDSLLDAYLGIVNSKLGSLPTAITKDNIYTTGPQMEDIYNGFSKLSDTEKSYVDTELAAKIPELYAKAHKVVKEEIIQPIVDFANGLKAPLSEEVIKQAREYYAAFTTIESKIYVDSIREEDKTLFSQYEKAKKIIADAINGKVSETVTSTPEKPKVSTPRTSDLTQVGPYTQLVGLSAVYIFIDKKNKDIIKKYE